MENIHGNIKSDHQQIFHNNYNVSDMPEVITYYRADSSQAPNQWETSLQSNPVSHWLGANLESITISLSPIPW